MAKFQLNYSKKKYYAIKWVNLKPDAKKIIIAFVVILKFIEVTKVTMFFY